MGDYRPTPPLAFAGWRLRIPGEPRGGQYHGYLGASPLDFANPGSHEGGIYRSPGEVPPRANANGDENTFMERHSRRQAGYAMVPGAYHALGYTNSVPAPVSNWRRYPLEYQDDHILAGSFNLTPQPPPPTQPQAAPTVAMPATPPNTYRDAAGNIVTDWHNPYVLYLPQSPTPAPTVAADTSPTPGAGQTPTSPNATAASWFTDPSQELINGIPNWGLIAAAAGAFLLLGRRR